MRLPEPLETHPKPIPFTAVEHVTLEDRIPGPGTGYTVPADYADQREAHLVGRLAASVHERHAKLLDWPTVTREPVRFRMPEEISFGAAGDPIFRPVREGEEPDYVIIRLEGWAVPR